MGPLAAPPASATQIYTAPSVLTRKDYRGWTLGMHVPAHAELELLSDIQPGRALVHHQYMLELPAGYFQHPDTADRISSCDSRCQGNFENQRLCLSAGRHHRTCDSFARQNFTCQSGLVTPLVLNTLTLFAITSMPYLLTCKRWPILGLASRHTLRTFCSTPHILAKHSLCHYKTPGTTCSHTADHKSH